MSLLLVRKLMQKFLLSKLFRVVIDATFILKSGKKKEYSTIRKRAKGYRNSSIKKIGIGLTDAYYYEHVKTLYQFYQRANTKMMPSIILPNKWPDRRRKEKLYNALETNYGISERNGVFSSAVLSVLQLDAYLETSVSTYVFRTKAKKILYAHGLAGLNCGKDYSLIQHFKNYDAIFLTGPLHLRAIKTAQQKYGSELPEIYEIGYLRGDSLLKAEKKYQRIKFFDHVNISLSKKAILYAPTWGRFSSMEVWLNRIVKLSADMGMSLILRLHPLIFTSKDSSVTGGIDWNERLQKLVSKFPHVFIDKSQKADDAILASSVLVTDVSGIGLEYLVLDKPVVFLPSSEYFRIFGEDRPEYWVRPKKEIEIVNDLRCQLDEALSGKWLGFSDEIVFNRGTALEKMSRAIENVVAR